MIKWEGIFRDERSNDNYKVVITNTDGDVQVDVPSESLEYGVELPQGYYMAHVHLNRQDPFCSHMTDKAEVGTGYYVWFNVTKEREVIYFNAVDDTITLYDLGDPDDPEDSTETDIDTLEQYQTIKLKGNTMYNIDGELYDVRGEEWLYYCTENTQVQSIIQYKNFDTRELMLSGESPVVVKYEGADDDIFKPVKYSSCTIKLLTHWYDPDLFSRTATSNKVQLFWESDPDIHDWNLKWEGYLTPNLYNQGFAYDVEELELEALDNLAALKNIRYEGTKSVKPASKILHSFLKDKVDHIFVSDSLKVGKVVQPDEEIPGFTTLEYLATDGSAFIDTGYYPCGTTFIETSVAVNYENVETFISLFGELSYNNPLDTDKKCQFVVRSYNHHPDVDRYLSTVQANTTLTTGLLDNAVLATLTKIEVGNMVGYTGGSARDSRLKVGDDLYVDYYAFDCIRADRSLYLFGHHLAHNPSDPDNSAPQDIVAGTSIGRFKIYEWEEQNGTYNKVLVRDLVPVKRNSDSMLGFYDVMVNQFYPNANSTGAFIQGSPASSSDTSRLADYTMLDYIATDGTAYIDTGYYPSNTTRVSSDFSVNYENMGGLPNSIYGAESDGKASIMLSVGDYDNVHRVGYLTATFCPNQTSAAIGESFAIKRNVELGFKYADSLERYASIKYDDTENEFVCYALDRSDKSMYLFGYNTFWNQDGHPRGLCAGTAIGRFKIYEWVENNGTYTKILVRDLVPVKRNSDSMLGFYDTINDNFLTNAANSGAFIQGSPASDEDSGKDLSDTDFEDPLSLNKLILSDYMFWDEDESKWGYSNEILEEICKYLGMTAVLQGRLLWIIDYADKGQRFCIYDNRTNDFEMRSQPITYRNNKDWGSSDYIDDNTQISMTSVYNQLKLQNDLSDFENLTDNLFLRKNLTNIYGARYQVDEGSQFDNSNQNIAIWEREPLISTDTTMYMWGDTTLSGQPITAMFQDPDVWIKEHGLPYWLDREEDINLGLLCKCCSLYYKVHSRPQTEYHAQTKDDRNDYIMLTNRHMNQDHQKLIEFSLNSDNIVQSTKSYYVINFGVIFSTAYFPCTDLSQKTTGNVISGVQESEGKIRYNNLKIMCRMQYSDLYWNGAYWQQEECDFPIQLDASEDYVEALNTELRVNNMVDFKTGLDLQGYLVPVPMESSASVGSVKLSFPHYQYISPDIKAVFITDLSVNLTMKKKDKEDSDEAGKWEEVIDKSYVGDLELDQSKYCTFDDTHLCYNTVGYLVDSDYYIMGLYKYGDWIMKLEQIRLLKYGLQFSHPRKVIDVTLKHIWDNPSTTFTNWNMGDVKFVMSSWSHDYKSGNTTLKLIERR